MHGLGLKHKHERRMRHKLKHLDKRWSRETKRYIRFLDKLTFIVGIIGPFTVLPQIYKIFINHQAEGVSALSWALIFAVTLPWVFYGFAHKEKPIIFSFILWEVMNLLVMIGALIY